MSDIEIRLHCIEAADGNLSNAKQIYDWVVGRDEPFSGGIVVGYPLKGSASDVVRSGGAGINTGIPVSSASATPA